MLRTDTDRKAFLEALADSDQVEVNEWEAGFIENCLRQTTYSVGQIKIIDRLFKEYDFELR